MRAGMKLHFLCPLLLIVSLHAGLQNHLKMVEVDKTKEHPLKHIDYLYLINLDERPGKLTKVLNRLEAYGITPYRFSAINGWDLSDETLNDIGLKYTPKMGKNQWVWHYPSEKNGEPELEFLREAIYGKTCFSKGLSLGAIGSTLSHLSVLQNALDAGYETIWVLEDQITFEQNPKVLSDLIEKLDKRIGKKGWDILLTGMDNVETLSGNKTHQCRPDILQTDLCRSTEKTLLSDDFVRVRKCKNTHSMIIRRSGMKKILNFEKKHGLFLPYKDELSLIPDIKLISLQYNVVATAPAVSDKSVDHFSQKTKWKNFKELQLEYIKTIPGWGNPVKAEKLMDFISEKRPKTIVEIGAFAGALTYPIAATLAFHQEGKVYAIDAWNYKQAIEGIESQGDIEGWKRVNFSSIQESFHRMIHTAHLGGYCRILPKPSKDAASEFADRSIDMLIIDGNPSAEGSFLDVQNYLPKVKPGGYIWLAGAGVPEKHKAILCLLEECTWQKKESMGKNFILFRKD